MGTFYEDMRLPEPPLEPAKAHGLTCDGCGVEIAPGETYIRWSEENYCEECAATAVRDELSGHGFALYLDRLAEVMGFDVLT